MTLKNIPLFLLIFMCSFLRAQESSEIYLFDLTRAEDSYILSNPVNISNHSGYDNQPSFTTDNKNILFTSMRNGQTDIALYNIESKERKWLTETPEDEYSPKSYPGEKKYFTCVRKENTGTQLLYKYAYRNKAPEVVVPNTIVAYYDWFDDKTLVIYVVGKDNEFLMVKNYKCNISYPLQYDVGRSFQKVESAQSVAFISKSHETSEIYLINPNTSESRYITDAIEGSEDMVWTPDAIVLMAKGDRIYKFRPNKDKNWSALEIDSDLPVANITRMAVSPDGTKIAIVVAEN